MGSILGSSRSSADFARLDPAITRHLKPLSLEDLFAAAEAVDDLRAHPGWAHVDRLLNAEIAEIEAGMDGKLLESHVAAALSQGRKQGLQFGGAVVDAIVRFAALKHEEQRAKHERDAESSHGG